MSRSLRPCGENRIRTILVAISVLTACRFCSRPFLLWFSPTVRAATTSPDYANAIADVTNEERNPNVNLTLSGSGLAEED
jgi:hypothetical protein